MEKVFIQTYSVRDESEKDFRGAMRRLAEIGYSGVEFAGYGGLGLDEMKELMRETGLEVVCAHVGPEQAVGDIEYLAALGAKYIVCPMAHIADYDEAMRVAEQLNAVGKKCAAAGLKYGYHNHTQEFLEAKGKYLLEHLIENTDPSLVVFELDVGWATTAGIDAPSFINKHAGRFDLIHVKESDKVLGAKPPLDFSKFKFAPDGRPIIPPEVIADMEAEQKTNVAMGKGIVDWRAVRAAADAQGAKAYVVEREWDYKGGDIFGCVAEDLAYLKTI